MRISTLRMLCVALALSATGLSTSVALGQEGSDNANRGLEGPAGDQRVPAEPLPFEAFDDDPIIGENDRAFDDQVDGEIDFESSGPIAEVKNGKFDLPTLQAATTATSQIGNGRLPIGYRDEAAIPREPLPETNEQRGYSGAWTFAEWNAANTFHYTLYFEDRMVERHGLTSCGRLQPIVSGARFVAQMPMLSYLATLNCPNECEYTLGYYRSGSCPPNLCQRPPYSRQAAVAEATAIMMFIGLAP